MGRMITILLFMFFLTFSLIVVNSLDEAGVELVLPVSKDTINNVTAAIDTIKSETQVQERSWFETAVAYGSAFKKSFNALVGFINEFVFGIDDFIMLNYGLDETAVMLLASPLIILFFLFVIQMATGRNMGM